MSALLIGLISVLALLVLVYAGMHVAIALILISFVGVWVIRGDITIASNLISLAASDSIATYEFGVIPLFVLMGMFVSLSGMGRDIFDVAHVAFRRIKGGLGVTTVAANAVFAAVTGVTIASASVFTKVAVPEMIRLGYQPRFAVGVVAGSSVLGMLIPPSLLFIIYGILAETSIGDLFISGILPGLLLSSAYVAYILVRAYWFPNSVIAHEVVDEDAGHKRSPGWYIAKIGPVLLLIVAVMGGIYGGVFTPTEAGGVGALVALLISLAKRKLDWRGLWRTLVETGHVTASIGLIIIAAHVYARMLAVAGVPKLFSDVLVGAELGLYGVLALYVALVIVLGTIIDAASIMLICVPLFLPVVLAFGADIVWFGVITVLAVEIGMLTPPFGIAVFVIRNNLRDAKISLNDIFAGAFPFACIMLLVLILIIAFPWFSLGLIR